MSIAELNATFGGPSEGRSDDRVPPQDLHAEQSVLGGMLLSKDAIADVVEVVRSTDFYRPAHQTIFDVVVDLYGKGEPADPITVSAELSRTGELARIGEIAEQHGAKETWLAQDVPDFIASRPPCTRPST